MAVSSRGRRAIGSFFVANESFEFLADGDEFLVGQLRECECQSIMRIDSGTRGFTTIPFRDQSALSRALYGV
jgi:hypothetical protein